MLTQTHPRFASRPDISEAESILRKCVHCGFCTATCPTYQLLGDELDGPRGRIHLIKNMLEEGEMTRAAGLHLDRCLTCRACETTCPSGVDYGRLLDIGKHIQAELKQEKGQDKWSQGGLAARLLLFVIPRRSLFAGLLFLGRLFRPFLPSALARKVPSVRKVPPVKASSAKVLPAKSQPDKSRPPDCLPDYLLLGGCVQSVATPSVNAAVQNLLEAKGKRVKLLDIQCCGSLHHHFGHHQAETPGKDYMMQVIHACADLPDVPIISSATGCGLTMKEYGQILPNVPAAAAFSKRVMDLSEVLENLAFDCEPLKVAVHTPCTMQHGMQLTGKLEGILGRAGFQVLPTREGHLCCGSAGAWSLLHPRLASQLLARKINALTSPYESYGSGGETAPPPDVIVTANIGCQLHLDSGTDLPVMHWVELLHQQSRNHSAS